MWQRLFCSGALLRLAAILFWCLAACAGPDVLDSSRVDPNAIWAKFMLDSESDSQKVLAAAQFRLNNESGAIVKLSAPSSVVVDDVPMELEADRAAALELDGNHYSLNLVAPEPKQRFSFVWTRPDSQTTTHVLERLPALRLKPETVPQKQFNRVQLSASIEGWEALDSDVQVVCLLEATDAALKEQAGANFAADSALEGAPVPNSTGLGAVIGAPSPTPPPAAPSQAPGLAGAQPSGSVSLISELRYSVPFGGSCLFTAEQLQQFRLGRARLRVVAQKTLASSVAASNVTLLYSRTWGPSALLEIVD